MKIVASYSIKGGVGKTATAVNLAYLAAHAGARTLLWDLDPQAAATYIFRIRPRVKGGGRRILRDGARLTAAIRATDFDGLDVLPADFAYRHMDLVLDAADDRPTEQLRTVLAPLADEYDLVVLDCPPSISLVSENVLHAADTVLIPLIPSPLSVRTFERLSEFLASTPDPPRALGFFSMVDRRKKLHRDITTDLPRQRTDIATTEIPMLAVVEQMAAQRAPVPHFAPRSVATRRYRELSAEAGLIGA